MFDATRGGLHESFLDGTVQIAIGGHVAEPTVSEDSGKQLAHTGCLSLSLSRLKPSYLSTYHVYKQKGAS